MAAESGPSGQHERQSPAPVNAAAAKAPTQSLWQAAESSQQQVREPAGSASAPDGAAAAATAGEPAQPVASGKDEQLGGKHPTSIKTAAAADKPAGGGFFGTYQRPVSEPASRSPPVKAAAAKKPAGDDFFGEHQRPVAAPAVDSPPVTAATATQPADAGVSTPPDTPEIQIGQGMQLECYLLYGIRQMDSSLTATSYVRYFAMQCSAC